MPYKDKDKQREYQREQYRRKKLGLPNKTISKKLLTPKEKLERRRESGRKHYKNLNKKVDELLGTKCYFGCEKIRLHGHRKDGKDHNAGGTQMKYDIIANPDEFVRLCQICHKGVHFCMDVLKMDWETILSHIK